MKILGILQNQWMKDPDRAYKVRGKLGFELFTKLMLFSGCRTGRRLREVFGEQVIRDWDWANASDEITSDWRSSPRYDVDHIEQTIQRVQPDIIILFGRSAREGFQSLEDRGFYFDGKVYTCPHPAHFASYVKGKLHEVAETIEKNKKEDRRFERKNGRDGEWDLSVSHLLPHSVQR